MIEAYGVKGMMSKSWRKTFRTVEAMCKWVEIHDAEIIGTRHLEEREVAEIKSRSSR